MPYLSLSNKNVRKLINDIKKTCSDNNVNLYLPKRNSIVLGNTRVAGYFYTPQNRKPSLVTAWNYKDKYNTIATLIHESCHLDQYLESKRFKNDYIHIDTIDKWLLGKDFPPSKIKKAFDITIQIELDCEKRAVQKIKDYNIPIDIPSYIQNANTYICFYHYLKITRTWDKNTTPLIPQVIRQAPKRFLNDYSKIPNKMLKAFEKFL